MFQIKNWINIQKLRILCTETNSEGQLNEDGVTNIFADRVLRQATKRSFTSLMRELAYLPKRLLLITFDLH